MKNILAFPLFVIGFLFFVCVYMPVHFAVRYLHQGCASLSWWWAKGDRGGVLAVLAIVSMLFAFLLSHFIDFVVCLSYRYGLDESIIIFAVTFLVSVAIVVPYKPIAEGENDGD